MGGHRAGEVAAKEASLQILDSISKMISLKKKTVFSKREVLKLLEKGFFEANERVFKLGNENQSFKGMGTTLSCLYLHNNLVHFAHVGDSRIYLFRNNLFVFIFISRQFFKFSFRIDFYFSGFDVHYLHPFRT